MSILYDPGELLCFLVWLLTLPPSLVPIERIARDTEQMGDGGTCSSSMAGGPKLQAQYRAHLLSELSVAAETPWFNLPEH